MYYPSSENKGPDNSEADLCICFRICKLSVFSRGYSVVIKQNKSCNFISVAICFVWERNHATPWQYIIFQKILQKIDNVMLKSSINVHDFV